MGTLQQGAVELYSHAEPEAEKEEQGCGVGILLAQVWKGLHGQFYTGALWLGGWCVRKGLGACLNTMAV